MSNQYTPLIDRFNAGWTPEPNTGCWLWHGAARSSRPGDMRPIINRDGKIVTGYRLAYELFVGPIPPGLFVCHECDVPLCVNPSHLFLGTCKDNILDARKKGRLFAQKNPEQNRLIAARGSKNRTYERRPGKSIIPHADVQLIIARIENGEHLAVIAKPYGVTKQALRQFIARAKARSALSETAVGEDTGEGR